MGQLEEKVRVSIRRTKLQEIILKTIATAGVISVALMAPNVIGAMGKLGILPYRRNREVVKSAADRLKRKGLIKFEDGRYSLTALGDTVWQRWQLSGYKLGKQNKWDRKWRVIIFDIPEKKRKTRTEVRRIFTQAGLRRLQDSVWIYPHDCEDVIGLLKIELGVGKDILYMVVDQLENDRRLREEFDLA